MSLHPRYSLLTLLVVTALVASAVMLWRGPHRVVEWPDTNLNAEIEYTFTRDWRGNKIPNGPFIQRFFKARTTTLQSVDLDFYRHGQKLPWCINFGGTILQENFSNEFQAKLDLTPEEQRAFEETIQQEKIKLAKHGIDSRGVFLKYVDD